VATLVAIAILFLLIYLGELIPVELPAQVLGLSSQNFWFFVLIIYSLFASSLPVWFLLQPRDYISTWILFLGLGLGYLGLIVFQPSIQAPAFSSFTSKRRPTLADAFCHHRLRCYIRVPFDCCGGNYIQAASR